MRIRKGAKELSGTKWSWSEWRGPRLRIIVAALSAGLALAVLLTIFVVNAGATASGDTYTWTGADASVKPYWSDPLNWTCSGPNCGSNGSTPVSDPHSDVVLGSGGDYSSNIDQSVDVNSLSILDPSYQIVGSGSLIVDTTATLAGSIGISGSQTYNGAVTISTAATIRDPSSVLFDSTVDSESGQTAQLLLFAPTTLSGAVGATYPLLTFSNQQATTIGGGTIDATQTVQLEGAVALTSDTSINAGTGYVNFTSTIDGAHSLGITAGTLVFDGDVGATTPLTSLTVSGTSATLDAGSVATSGMQAYSNGLEAESAATFTGAGVTFGGALTTSSGQAVTIDGPAMFAGGASGLGNLAVNGNLTISAGTFTAPGSGSTLSIGGNPGGNLDVTGGSFGNNNGTVTFDGSGSTQQLQGTVPQFAGLSVASGSQLDTNGNSVNAESITGSGEITDGGAPATLVVSPTSGDTFPGAIAGSLSLVSNDTGGELALTGPVSYSGSTTIGSGGLVFTGPFSLFGDIVNDGSLTFQLPTTTAYPGSISGSGSLTQAGPGTLALAGAVSYTGTTTAFANAPLVFAGSLSLTGNIIDGGSIAFQLPSATTYAGIISGSGLVQQTGSTALTFDGANTYTGGTQVVGGKLDLGPGGSLVSSGAVSVAQNTTFDISQAGNQTIGDLSGNGAVNLGANMLTLGTGNSMTYGGTFAGSGGVTKQGTGVLTLTGNSQTAPGYTGTTTIAQGTVDFDNTDNFGTGEILLNGGTLQWAQNNTADPSSALSLGPSGGTLDTNGNDVTLSSSVSGPGGLTKVGAGVLTMAAPSTYTGGTQVQDGTLQLGSAGALAPTGAVSLARGTTFDISQTTAPDQTIGDLSGSGFVNLGSNTLTLGTSNSTTFSGIVAGQGGLTKIGSGTFELTGPNSYGGATQVQGGTLQLAPGGSLPSATALSLTSGTTFDMSPAGNQTIGDLSGSGGTVNLGYHDLQLGTLGSTTFSGQVVGTGELTKVGTGTLTLDGQSTYTGGTFVQDGTLQLGRGGSLATNGSVSVGGPGTNASFDISQAGDQTIGGLSSNGDQVTVNLGSNTLTLAGGTQDSTYSGTFVGSGGIIKQGGGTLTLTADSSSTFSGSTLVTGGLIDFNSGQQLRVARSDHPERRRPAMGHQPQQHDLAGSPASGSQRRHAGHQRQHSLPDRPAHRQRSADQVWYRHAHSLRRQHLLRGDGRHGWNARGPRRIHRDRLAQRRERRQRDDRGHARGVEHGQRRVAQLPQGRHHRRRAGVQSRRHPHRRARRSCADLSRRGRHHRRNGQVHPGCAQLQPGQLHGHGGPGRPACEQHVKPRHRRRADRAQHLHVHGHGHKPDRQQYLCCLRPVRSG